MLITIDTFWALLANNSPLIIAAILFYLYQTKQQNHELTLRRIDLYEKPRQEALADCAYKLSRCANSPDVSKGNREYLQTPLATLYIKQSAFSVPMTAFALATT